MANGLMDGRQSRVNRGANNLMGLVGLIPPKSADLVGNCIGSAQNLVLIGRYGKEHMRIGTWNARTMQKRGKLNNIKRDMRQNRVNIL